YQVIEAVLAPGTPNASGTVYVNGVPGATNTSMNNLANVTRADPYIGQASAGGRALAGNIVELLVYNTQLSSAQIAGIQSVLTETYQLLNQAPAAPIISLAGGTLKTPAFAAITPANGTGVVHFTTDLSIPSASSPVYQGPVPIIYSQTVKAITVLGDAVSGVSSATYSLDATQFPAPPSNDMTAPSINLQLPAASQ
ncbi:MAG: LamG-like jellyroll fold domain-containing protein, partial [Candidatus Saccharimonadales bacterium]